MEESSSVSCGVKILDENDADSCNKNNKGGDWGGSAGERCGEGGRRSDPTAAVASGTPRGSRGKGGPEQVGRLLVDVGRSGGNGKWARLKKHSVVFIFTQKISKRIELI
jgi:hypothetical protein